MSSTRATRSSLWASHRPGLTEVATTVTAAWTGDGLEFTGGGAGAEKPHALLDGNGRAAPSPVQALLLALVSCTGSDVVEIAKKMRVPLTSLEVTVEGDRNEDHPRRFNRIRVVYRVTGVAEADRDKIRRALELSNDRYCSVRHSLRTDLDYSAIIEFA